jgi:hypothetical protein
VVKNTDKYIEQKGVRYKLTPDHRVPTDDPDLPSYESESYRQSKAQLEFIMDMFEGFNRWKNAEEITDLEKAKRYLPQWAMEPRSAHESRIKRTEFSNFFAPAVKGFPGFLSDIKTLDTLYPGLVEHESNVDLQGNNLISFCWQADLKAVRDGFCGILLDMPKPELDSQGNKVKKTLADRNLPRPYLVLIDRRDILSIHITIIDGKLTIEQVTIREFVSQRCGRFGTEVITRYRTFWCDGEYKVEVIVDDKDGKCKALEIDAGCTDLRESPLVLYSATDICPLEAAPPLESLAETTRAYYELNSEYREIILKLNTPVAVRTGLLQPGMVNVNELPPIIIGSNTGIDLPTGGTFSFESPDGSVLETDRLELDRMIAKINAESLKFFSGVEGENKTATEVRMSATQTKATLQGMALLKESALEQISEKWARFYGHIGQGGTCTVNCDLLQLPLTEGEINALSSLATANHISVITLLELLKEGKRLPEAIKPSQEVRRIEAQFKLKLRQAADTQKQKVKQNANTNSENQVQ